MINLAFNNGMARVQLRIDNKMVTFTHELFGGRFVDISKLPVNPKDAEKFNILLERIRQAYNDEEIVTMITNDFKDDGYILEKRWMT